MSKIRPRRRWTYAELAEWCRVEMGPDGAVCRLPYGKNKLKTYTKQEVLALHREVCEREELEVNCEAID